ncbi:MAG: hypothetical protein KTR29_04270 [Rhodothermaceae bacterium]|nr:hypothetical protein [Rhodothermaceae bacterium]
MSDDIKRLLATLAGYPVLWCFSMLIHMVDAGLSNSEGIAYLIFMPSVYLFAALVFIPCVVAVIGFGTYGMRVYWIIVSSSALLISLLITAGGSTATDMMGLLVSFSGMTLISALFLIPGTLPGVFFLRMAEPQA